MKPKSVFSKKALFITFEGGEGSGKSTQIRLLSKFFKEKKINCVVFREPGSSELGEKIRKILLNSRGCIYPETELFLYLASRAQFIKEKLIPVLKKPGVVISDRFSDSTLVYQGYALKLGIDRIKSIVEFASLGVRPDLTFFLDVKPENALSRINRGKDRIEERPLTFHRNIQKGYRLLAEKYPKRIKVIRSEDKSSANHKIIEIVSKLR